MLKHNEICKQFINKSGGKVIKDIGDAVFASYTSPRTRYPDVLITLFLDLQNS